MVTAAAANDRINDEVFMLVFVVFVGSSVDVLVGKANNMCQEYRERFVGAVMSAFLK
jgi:hypothetical protein